MPETVAVFAVVLVGLMVGVELAVAAFVNPVIDRLPNDAGLAARSDAARVLGRVMPFWYGGSVVLGVLWTAQTWGGPLAPMVATAAALLVAGVVMSIVLLIPINARVAQWSDGDAPADWRDQVSRWDRFHYMRVAVIVTAFALLAVAGVVA